MIYSKNNMYIDSDFEIRTVREDEKDIDLFISIGNKTLNLYFDDTQLFINSRMQFLEVRNLIFRFSINRENNISTVHILRNVDLHSAVVNFEIDYSKYKFNIKDKKYFVEMKIEAH